MFKEKLDAIIDPKIDRVKHEIIESIGKKISYASANLFGKLFIEQKFIKKQNRDLIWARVWDDTKTDIDWLKGLPGISPGRWAVGYNYIYVMTRVLNEFRPSSVLDLGLGISSTLISQYFQYYHPSEGLHLVIEQDKEWHTFYMKKHKLSDYSSVCITECIEREYKGDKYYAYEGFLNLVSDHKFSVISIDGPTGSETYSRRDILDVIPQILTPSFIIIIDDMNRKGEQSTLAEIETKLHDNNVKYQVGWYYGLKDCCVIASEDNKYFCTL